MFESQIVGNDIMNDSLYRLNENDFVSFHMNLITICHLYITT